MSFTHTGDAQSRRPIYECEEKCDSIIMNTFDRYFSGKTDYTDFPTIGTLKKNICYGNIDSEQLSTSVVQRIIIGHRQMAARELTDSERSVKKIILEMLSCIDLPIVDDYFNEEIYPNVDYGFRDFRFDHRIKAAVRRGDTRAIEHLIQLSEQLRAQEKLDMSSQKIFKVQAALDFCGNLECVNELVHWAYIDYSYDYGDVKCMECYAVTAASFLSFLIEDFPVKYQDYVSVTELKPIRAWLSKNPNFKLTGASKKTSWCCWILICLTPLMIFLLYRNIR